MPSILRVSCLVLVALSGAGGFPLEAPPAYEVELEFKGNEAVSSGNLETALRALRADLRRQGVTPGDVEDAVYELERYYALQGFRSARIAGGYDKKEKAFTIRLSIDEGPRSLVGEVTFEGNKHFSSEDLSRCFSWSKTGWFGIGADVYTDAALAEGIDCILGRYQLEGFFFAEVVPSVADDAGARVRVAVQVREGKRIALASEPRFEGVEAFSVQEVRDVLELKVPCNYLPRLPLVLKGKLVDFYRARGYRFVEVDVERAVDAEAGEAMLTFKVREGPLTRVRDIHISGNATTREWVLRNRIRLRAGDIYNEERVRESYRSLLRSGLFSSVSMENRPVEGTADQVDLDVSVSEKARYNLAVFGGYGSYEMLRGKVSVEDGNLFGMGHRVQVEGHGSFRGEGASVEYLNPFVFDDRVSHHASGFFDRREHPSFMERQYGGETGLSYRLTENVRTTALYRLKESQSLDVDPDIPPELISDVFLSTIGSSTVMDWRNNIVDPDRGSTHHLTVEYGGSALGSELDFIRVTGFMSWIFPLFWDLRLVAAARAGVIQPLATTEVIPIQERFFNGGEYTIRSYRQDEAGPQVDGEPIGGEAFTSYNLELRFPLVILEGLRGAVFGDTGTLTEEVDEFAGGRYYFGVGTGVRYNTPFGPLRVDVAFNPDREKGEDFVVVHFGLGYPF